MSIEAMKQALEAMGSVGADLICESSHHRKKYYHEGGVECPLEKQWHESYEALRQAIEQAEKQEPVAWMVRDSIDGSWYPCAFENPAGAIKGESKPLYAVPQQAEKQEPIAWMVYTLDGASAFVTDNPNDFTELHSCFALYTAPPKREWVGLTELEIKHYNNRLSGSNVAQEIESKLRERNT
jgi:hypothetical protein